MDDITIDWSAVAAAAAEIALILVVAVVAIWLLRRVICRVVSAHISSVREETAEDQQFRTEILSIVAVRVVSILVWITAGAMILGAIGLDVVPLAAVLGVIFIAIAFTLQNIARDYIRGFLIYMEDWFRIGEVASVGIDPGGTNVMGTVVAMGFRRTVLRDLDGTMHIIPNNRIELAANMGRDWARINLDVSVAYKENLDEVIRVINDVCLDLKEDAAWGEDLLTVPHVERVNDLGDSGIDIKILADTKPLRQWALTGELRKRLKDRFDIEGIEIPWPHSKVYFGEVPTGKDSLN